MLQAKRIEAEYSRIFVQVLYFVTILLFLFFIVICMSLLSLTHTDGLMTSSQGCRCALYAGTEQVLGLSNQLNMSHPVMRVMQSCIVMFVLWMLLYPYLTFPLIVPH